MEPMDFDTDVDNSAKPTMKLASVSKFNMSGRDNLSDMDIDPDSPGQCQATVSPSTSFDHMSSALISVLSFKNISDNDAHISYKKSVSPVPSAPCQENQKLSSAVTTDLEAVSFKKAKTGYGIPDEETIFAHFPNTNACGNPRKRQPINISVLDTQVQQEPMDSMEDNYQKHKSNYKPKLSPERIPKKYPSCLCFVGSLILIILIVIAVHHIRILHNVNEREKCQLSRDFNKRLLEMELNTNVFGQHIAAKTVPDKIEEYFRKFHTSSLSQHPISSTQEDLLICKPLVLSFDGWTGVGKNYVSKFIYETFQNSKVMHYVIPLNFPHMSFEDVYRLQIQQWIIGNFTKCMVNIIVLDEMDKAFPSIIDGLIETINKLTQPCFSADPTIIMLLSNTHANYINRIALKFLLESPKNKREQLSEVDFSSIFTSELNNWSSALVSKHFIDAFVPFLPLEREHVVQCIKRDLVSKSFSTDEITVNKVLQELSFSSIEDIHISQTGCKRVADKVDLVMFEKNNIS